MGCFHPWGSILFCVMYAFLSDTWFHCLVLWLAGMVWTHPTSSLFHSLTISGAFPYARTIVQKPHSFCKSLKAHCWEHGDDRCGLASKTNRCRNVKNNGTTDCVDHCFIFRHWLIAVPGCFLLALLLLLQTVWNLWKFTFRVTFIVPLYEQYFKSRYLELFCLIIILYMLLSR